MHAAHQHGNNCIAVSRQVKLTAMQQLPFPPEHHSRITAVTTLVIFFVGLLAGAALTLGVVLLLRREWSAEPDSAS